MHVLKYFWQIQCTFSFGIVLCFKFHLCWTRCASNLVRKEISFSSTTSLACIQYWVFSFLNLCMYFSENVLYLKYSSLKSWPSSSTTSGKCFTNTQIGMILISIPYNYLKKKIKWASGAISSWEQVVILTQTNKVMYNSLLEQTEDKSKD